MDSDVVTGLRANGVDVITTYEVGRLGSDDESQLSYATAGGRAIYTANRHDFARLHARWMAEERHRAGIIIRGRQQLSGDAQIVRLLAVWRERDVGEMADQLLFV
jgi:hypothetical protein